MKRFATSLLATAAIFFSLTSGPAAAGESGRHSGAASDHSARAVSHGSAAIATGAGVVMSVPVAVSGVALSAAGAGFDAVGNASTQAGSGLIRSSIDLSNGPTTKTKAVEPVRPDAAPRLD